MFFFFIIIIDCKTHTSYITLKLTFNYITYITLLTQGRYLQYNANSTLLTIHYLQ